MRVLVTGGAGFIGSHVVDRLVNKRHQVFVIDDLSGGFKENVNPKAHFIKCDLRNPQKTKYYISRIKPELVYHLAANAAENKAQYSPIDITSRNWNTFINTLTSSLGYGMRRFVFTSSIAVYGSIKPPFNEKAEPYPEDLYGVSKLMVEKSLAILSKVHGFEYVIIRPHNVYGPRQNMQDPYRNVVTIFMNSILKNEPYFIYGKGNQIRCFSFIEDVADAIFKCGFLPVNKKTFNVGSDKKCSISTLSKIIQKVTHTKINPIYLPKRIQEVDIAVATHGLAKKHLKYREITPLETGLRKTWEHVKQQGHQKPKFTPLEIKSPFIPANWLPKQK